MTSLVNSQFTCIYTYEHMSNCHAIDVCLLKADLVNKNTFKSSSSFQILLFSLYIDSSTAVPIKNQNIFHLEYRVNNAMPTTLLCRSNQVFDSATSSTSTINYLHDRVLDNIVNRNPHYIIQGKGSKSKLI